MSASLNGAFTVILDMALIRYSVPNKIISAVHVFLFSSSTADKFIVQFYLFIFLTDRRNKVPL